MENKQTLLKIRYFLFCFFALYSAERSRLLAAGLYFLLLKGTTQAVLFLWKNCNQASYIVHKVSQKAFWIPVFPQHWQEQCIWFYILYFIKYKIWLLFSYNPSHCHNCFPHLVAYKRTCSVHCARKKIFRFGGGIGDGFAVCGWKKCSHGIAWRQFNLPWQFILDGYN